MERIVALAADGEGGVPGDGPGGIGSGEVGARGGVCGGVRLREQGSVGEGDSGGCERGLLEEVAAAAMVLFMRTSVRLLRYGGRVRLDLPGMKRASPGRHWQETAQRRQCRRRQRKRWEGRWEAWPPSERCSWGASRFRCDAAVFGRSRREADLSGGCRRRANGSRCSGD